MGKRPPLRRHQTERRGRGIAAGEGRARLDRGYDRSALTQHVTAPEPEIPEHEVEPLVRRFNALYCRVPQRTWANTYWLGVRTMKCPLDLWVYQEILFRHRPDVIVETGTHGGGSAHFLASMCELVGAGRVLSIDIKKIGEPPSHERINYIRGSSIDPETVSLVRDAIQPGDAVMVILDAMHQQDFVLKELGLYAPLVSKGQYLVVEDTNINYWWDTFRGRTGFGPGPLEAVQSFLQSEQGRDFRVDQDAEKFFMTFSPGGYLIRE
jgi:cephalosporin hydroxylase